MPVITKTLSTLFRALEVLGTMYCIGVTTYFVIKIAKHDHMHPDGKTIAIEVISGAGFLYACFMLLLSICLLQKTFFQFLTVLWDLLFCGGFVAIAVLLRHAAGQKCGGTNMSPAPTFLENADSRASINCKLVKGLFGAAVGLAALFLITAILALLAHSRSRKDRANGMDSTYSSRHGRREKDANELPHHHTRIDHTRIVAPVAAAGVIATEHHRHNRESADTSFTKDTEKASDLDSNNHIGRDYGTGTTYPPRATGATLIPAAIPAPKNASPMPSNYSSKYNYENTRPGRTTNYDRNSYNNNRQPTSAQGFDTVQQSTPYNNTSRGMNAAELSSSPNSPSTGRNIRHNLEETDPDVGGLTGNIYHELHTKNRHIPEMEGERRDY